MSDRCAHDKLWYEFCGRCSIMPPPSSMEERLLAGSLAIAELAALRKKIGIYQCEFWNLSDEFFGKARHEADDERMAERWRARGSAWHEAANKLKELLETK